MNNSFSSGRYLLIIASFTLLLLNLPGGTPSAQAVSTNIVISEFRVRGPGGGNDEFIELYNLSSSAVNIGGWKIRGSNAAGSVNDRLTITAGTVLNPGCHYLVTNSAASGYSGSVPGNQSYSTGITDDGGIALTLSDNTIIDQVGMSNGSTFKEGTPLTSLISNLNRGYERKPGGAAGSGTDTDNNNSDFQLVTPSDPQNLSSPCLEGDAAPEVSSTVPASGAGDIALDANITINFNEAVNASGTWFDLTCTTSGSHTATASGGPSSFTLDPDIDFVSNETCEVTIFAVQVTDQDSDDPPDNLEENYVWSFSTVAPPPPSSMMINELDSDTLGTDALEFVELYDGGTGNTDLSGLVLVFYNGEGDTSYASFDLDGFTTNAAGYFLLGNNGVSPTPGLSFSNNTLQNGPDAVALYNGNASNFPNGTPVTAANLIDALVYDTADADDPGLLVLLNAGQLQVDEAGGGNSAGQSSQRCPNGSGGQRNTHSYLQNTPSAGAANNCGVPATIMQIQSAAHRSPLEGQLVRDVPGIVTALRSNGFYMQDAAGDGDIATSDGIFVFTDDVPPTVAVGDAVLVRGSVSEFRPGGSSGPNLTISELTAPFTVVISSSNSLPTPVIIGTGGRVPPAAVIDDDNAGDIETGGSFDPSADGIDFYESLEGMRVQVNDAVAVGPRSDFGSNREIPVVTDDGANAGVRTGHGGIVIQPADFNPERIILNDLITGGPPLPPVNVGDSFPGVTVGIIDYSFGNFKLEVTTLPALAPGDLARETTADPTAHQLAVASFNVENLHPGNPADKFAELADLIVHNLKAPDLIAVEEIQDNNGPTNDSVVEANDTFATLIAAIQNESGITYQFRQINPIDDADGGQPGGNIRVGFLFRTDRGLTFVDRAGGTSTAATTVVDNAGEPELSFSPGRIEPANLAFDASRKPLAGEFSFKGDKVFVIANHFSSKGGDNPLFGRFQPPVRITEIQRHQQAQAVNNFVEAILAVDDQANVIVLGDINDFEFSETVTILKSGEDGPVLNDLIETLRQDERYSYVFEGNSQTLDHILVSNALFARPLSYDSVHVNAEFSDQASDHDPQAAQLCVDATPPALTANLSPNTLWPPNHKYVPVKATVVISDNADPNPELALVSITSNEPDQGQGKGDKPNDIVIVDDFNFQLRAERFGSGSGRIYTVTYEATDACGNSTTATATVTVPHNQGNSAAAPATPTDTSGTDSATTSPGETDTGAAPASPESEPTPTDTGEADPAETDTPAEGSNPEDGSATEGESGSPGTDTGEGTDDTGAQDGSTAEDESGSSDTDTGENPEGSGETGSEGTGEGSDPAETEDSSDEAASEEEATPEGEPAPSDIDPEEGGEGTEDSGTEDDSGEAGSEDANNPEDTSD